MLIFDIDGTILDNNEKWIPELKEYIEELNEKGCWIAFNTSRHPKDTKAITDQLNFKPYLCCCSGGLIFDKDSKVISKVPVSEIYFKEYLDSVFDIGLNFAVTMYDNKTNFTYICKDNLINPERVGKDEREMVAESKENHRFVVSKERFYDILTSDEHCILSASIISDADSMESLKEMRNVVEYSTEYHIGFDILYSTTYAEVISANHSKGSAIKRLREKLNPYIMVAVGDSNTDIPAFAQSDISIAIKSEHEHSDNSNTNNAWKNSTYVVSQDKLVEKLKALEKKGLLY